MTAQELLTARNALGLTQEALGRALGLSRAMIVAMERGRRPVQRVTELAIRHILWDGACECEGCLIVQETISHREYIDAAKKSKVSCHQGGEWHNWLADGTCTDCCAINPPQNHS